MNLFISLLLSGVIVGVIYGLVAVGFVLIYKASGIFNFAQGEIVLLGAYICWTFLGPLNLPAWAAIVISLMLAVSFGLAVERFALRPMIGESVLALIMATLALSYLFWGGTMIFWGAAPLEFVKVFPSGIISVGEISVTTEQMCAILVTGVLFIVLTLFFRYTRLGLAMRGTAEGHSTVRSMGISPETMIGASWAVASVVATIGGILLGSIIGFSVTLKEIGLVAIPAAFVGGLDSILGAIIGGLVIGVVQMLAGGYIGMASGTPATFLVLILVMFLKPAGLFGLARIERV